jgi:hypothetical protein
LHIAPGGFDRISGTLEASLKGAADVSATNHGYSWFHHPSL